jgi:flagellar biogenesis protein FliO
MKVAALLLLPLWLGAQSPAPAPDPVAEKFQKFQQEYAGDGADPSPAAPPESRSLFRLVLEVGAALALVLALAVLGIRLLRKAQRGMLAGPAGGDLLEVVESCHLGPGQRLVAVRLDGKIGVLGVTREAISLVATLDRPAGEVIQERRRQGNPAQFSENLNRMLERFRGPKKAEFPPA